MNTSDSIAFTLYITDWIDGHTTVSELPEASIKALYCRWVKEILPARNDDHKGECTGIEMKCRRCEIEKILENATAIAKVLKECNNEPTIEIEKTAETS